MQDQNKLIKKFISSDQSPQFEYSKNKIYSFGNKNVYSVQFLEGRDSTLVKIFYENNLCVKCKRSFTESTACRRCEKSICGGCYIFITKEESFLLASGNLTEDKMHPSETLREQKYPATKANCPHCDTILNGNCTDDLKYKNVETNYYFKNTLVLCPFDPANCNPVSLKCLHDHICIKHEDELGTYAFPYEDYNDFAMITQHRECIEEFKGTEISRHQEENHDNSANNKRAFSRMHQKEFLPIEATSATPYLYTTTCDESPSCLMFNPETKGTKKYMTDKIGMRHPDCRMRRTIYRLFAKCTSEDVNSITTKLPGLTIHEMKRINNKHALLVELLEGPRSYTLEGLASILKERSLHHLLHIINQVRYENVALSLTRNEELKSLLNTGLDELIRKEDGKSFFLKLSYNYFRFESELFVLIRALFELTHVIKIDMNKVFKFDRQNSPEACDFFELVHVMATGSTELYFVIEALHCFGQTDLIKHFEEWASKREKIG